MAEDSSSLKDSLAFKEYAKGPNEKVKPPWVTIIVTGVLVGIAYVATEMFATIVYDNPYALNFILALYGIPAGFVCGLKNDNLSLLTSLRYSTFSALFSIVTFGLISAFFIGFSANHTMGVIVGIVELLIALAMIMVFSMCVTFAFGAFLGTLTRGVRDNKR
ncbi:MAG: hypothetical protein JXA54_04135 [Candidatus Heimdallarchaeota archaeon]|nr:hypothetical protein [Candidatus Heimdallarchaeota archaeon]